MTLLNRCRKTPDNNGGGAASSATIQAQKDRQPGIIDTLRVRWKWFDHTVNAYVRYTEQNGRFYAGGITYFSVLSIFPLAMVAFALIGVALFQHPEMLVHIQKQIVAHIPGTVGEKIGALLTVAVTQRNTVGVIGFLTAVYSGLGWIGNLRDGLTAQWALLPRKYGFVKKKITDLLTMVGLFVALIVSFGVSALGSSGLVEKCITAWQLEDIPGITAVSVVVSVIVSLLALWVLLFWVIGFLPRERAGHRESARAALLTALLMVSWIQLAAFYLKKVMGSPIGTIFGPVIGILVFLFFTWQIILFGAAWAATFPTEIAATETRNRELATQRAKEEADAEAKRHVSEQKILLEQLEESREKASNELRIEEN